MSKTYLSYLGRYLNINYNNIMAIKKLSKKEIRKLEEEGRLRDYVEIWVDQHNHKLELLRTITSLIAAIASSVVLLKLLHIIN